MATATPALPAKEAMSKLDAQLTCAICLEHYTDPRMLPCQHTYCKGCIAKAVEVEMEKHIVKCPSCRKVAQVSEKGASALPVAFHLNGLLEINDLFKKTAESHQLCSKHEKPKDIYCERCEELICIKCGINQHRDHQYDLADDLFKKHKQEIEELLKSVDERIDEATQTLPVYDTTEKEIREQGEAVKQEIDQTIQKHTTRLMEELQQSKNKLYDEADAATSLKLQLHSLEKAEVETTLAQLKSCKEFMEEELRSRSQHQIQTARKKLVQRIKDTHTAVNASELKPAQKPNTRFVKAFSDYENIEVGRVTSN